MDSESSASRRNFAFRSIAARIEQRGTITRLQLRGWNSYDDSLARESRERSKTKGISRGRDWNAFLLVEPRRNEIKGSSGGTERRRVEDLEEKWPRRRPPHTGTPF